MQTSEQGFMVRPEHSLGDGIETPQPTAIDAEVLRCATELNYRLVAVLKQMVDEYWLLVKMTRDPADRVWQIGHLTDSD